MRTPSQELEFSDEQLEIFETRFEEGYDIYEDIDDEYVQWFKIYHAEALPSYLHG